MSSEVIGVIDVAVQGRCGIAWEAVLPCSDGFAHCRPPVVCVTSDVEADTDALTRDLGEELARLMRRLGR